MAENLSPGLERLLSKIVEVQEAQQTQSVHHDTQIESLKEILRLGQKYNARLGTGLTNLPANMEGNFDRIATPLQNLRETVEQLIQNNNANNNPVGPVVDANRFRETGQCKGTEDCRERFSVLVTSVNVGGRLKFICSLCEKDYINYRKHSQYTCFPKTCCRRPQR